ARVASPGADERHDVFALLRDPGDGDLRHRGPDGLGDGSQLFHQSKIRIEICALEARRVGAKVALPLARLRPMPADQPARQNAIRSDADAKLAAGGKDLALDPARNQRVLALHIADRVNGIGAPDRVGADLGKTDMADI